MLHTRFAKTENVPNGGFLLLGIECDGVIINFNTIVWMGGGRGRTVYIGRWMAVWGMNELVAVRDWDGGVR